MFVGIFIGYRIAKNMHPSLEGESNLLTTVIKKINTDYVDKVDRNKLEEVMVNGILTKLDPFSVYIPPLELASVNERMSGSFQGIGVEYMPGEDTPMVIRTIVGGGAARAGILPGDRLLKADTNSLLGVRDIGKFVKGPSGTGVMLTIQRQSRGQAKIHKIFVTRGVVPIQSSHIAYAIRPQIGYIKLDRFSITSHTELRNSLQELLHKGMRKVILDLRNNGGGVLDAALDIAGEFLPKDKLILYTEAGNHQRHKEYRNQRDGLFKDLQVVVLMNRSSASASEVVAGSLQDWDRATVIGENSFGKGLVQEQFILPNRGALRLTIARYYTPLGRCIQKNYFSNNRQQNHIIHYDSSLFRIDTFTTARGKKVFSSGGIRPDIFVEQNLAIPLAKQDTVDFLKVISAKKFRIQLMRYFANNYASWQKQYAKPQAFLQGHQLPSGLINQVLQVLGKNKVQNVSLRRSVKRKIQIELLSLLFPEQKYLPILLEQDSSIQASLHYFNSLVSAS